MKPMKIAFVGRIRSGKNTAADYLVEKYGLKPFSFGSGIADVIQQYFPSAFEDGKPRKHYQVIGQSFRELNPDIWIEVLEEKLKAVWEENPNTGVVITDLRQANEYKRLKELGFTIIKVKASELKRIQRMELEGDVFTSELLNHETELQAENCPFDYLLVNNTSLEDMYNQLQVIMSRVIKEGDE